MRVIANIFQILITLIDLTVATAFLIAVAGADCVEYEAIVFTVIGIAIGWAMLRLIGEKIVEYFTEDHSDFDNL